MRSAPKILQTIREHSTTRPPTVANVKSNDTNVTATEVSVDISLARRNLADDDSTDASPTCGDEIETCLLLNKSEHEADPTEDRVGGVEFVDGITDVEESPLLTTSAGNFYRRTSAISARDDKDCSSPINNTDDMGSYFFYDRGPLLLPKTFTEPSNLNELLKQASASLHKKIRRSTIVSPVDEEAPTKNLHNLESPCRIVQQRSTANRTYGSRSHYSNMSTDGVVATAAKASSAIVNDAYGYIDDDFESVGKKLFKNQLLQGGSSSFHLRQKDVSTNNGGSCSKINDTCGQCPRCSRHGRFNTIASPSLTAARFVGDTSACPCRICRLLDPDTSPSLFAPTTSSTSSRHQKLGHRDELGALCQMCGHSEAKTSTDGRCSRFATSAASGAVDDVHSTPDVNCTFVAASNSFAAGLITCREQGVQVSKWSLSSVSSCSGPLCRICHSPGDKIEALMSPCRCSGSLKFVHMSCLLRWLEISRRKLHRAPHCELCGYKYQRHKIMRFRRFQCPPCSRRDKVLHVTFVLSILIMIVCACTTIIFFKGDKHSNATNSTKTTDKTSELSGQEIVTLICGVMFFCAFFLAMYVQVKAQATIYKLMMRFWMMNQEWHIEEYRRDRDIDYRDARNNVSELGSDV